MVQGIKNLWLVIYFLWTFRKFFWELLCEFNELNGHMTAISAAYKGGNSHFAEAQSALSSLLCLRSFKTFVKTTATLDDDLALEKMKVMIQNTMVFRIAWRILHGDWNVNVEQSRWSRFVDGIRSKLPFVDRTKAVKALASVSDDQPLLTELEEMQVTSIIGILVVILNILPYILDFIKKRREKKCY